MTRSQIVACSCKFSRANQVEGLPDGLKPRFLANLPAPDLSRIVLAAEHRTFRARSQILHAGTSANRLYLLTSGSGRHFAITELGRKILLHWLTAGQILGGPTMLARPAQYLVNAELVEDCCALTWDRRTIRALLSHYPGLLDNALAISYTEHIAWLISMQVSLMSDDAHGRVAHLLVSLACAVGHPRARGSIELQIKNADLAAGANVSASNVSRLLNEWERAGVLQKDRGKILLRQPRLLAAQHSAVRGPLRSYLRTAARPPTYYG
jgi:CRP-like cAMP-binding protein